MNYEAFEKYRKESLESAHADVKEISDWHESPENCQIINVFLQKHAGLMAVMCTKASEEQPVLILAADELAQLVSHALTAGYYFGLKDRVDLSKINERRE